MKLFLFHSNPCDCLLYVYNYIVWWTWSISKEAHHKQVDVLPSKNQVLCMVDTKIKLMYRKCNYAKSTLLIYASETILRVILD